MHAQSMAPVSEGHSPALPAPHSAGERFQSQPKLNSTLKSTRIRIRYFKNKLLGPLRVKNVGLVSPWGSSSPKRSPESDDITRFRKREPITQLKDRCPTDRGSHFKVIEVFAQATRGVVSYERFAISQRAISHGNSEPYPSLSR